MNDIRIELEGAMSGWERLLNTLSVKYVELLEEEESGSPAPLAKEYLQERVNYVYEMWHYTKVQLDKLPPLAKDCTLPALTRAKPRSSREHDNEGAGDRDGDKTED
jgi:hypothetical protein